MYAGNLVFAQLMELAPWHTFRRLVSKYDGDFNARTFRCRDQFLCMAFAQLTYRQSLRDIAGCLQAQPSKLYHMGIRGNVTRSNLADANERRDWRIYAEFAQSLIGTARRLYADDDLGLDLEGTVYALDSTTISLCLSLFPWADYRETKAAVKIHTLLDLRGAIPAFMLVSDGLLHDVNILDLFGPEPGSFYVMDRAYVDFERLFTINQAGAFFVTRAKKPLKFKRISSQSVDKSIGLICDQEIVLTGFYSRKGYPRTMRRVRLKDPETGKTLVFLTNNFEITAHSTDSLRSLPQSLASRVVLQVDQTASSNQPVFRALGERREVPDMDRRSDILAGRHRQETPAGTTFPALNASDSERNSIREYLIRSITYRFGPADGCWVNGNQLKLL